jgi:hypothetical protein|tara:strand:- start:1668 stop:8444 length:6777 start_codon:yes stop_codon:yes gene_type:complete
MTLQEYVISLQNQNLSQEEIYTKVEEWKKNNPQPQVEEEVEEVVEEKPIPLTIASATEPIEPEIDVEEFDFKNSQNNINKLETDLIQISGGDMEMDAMDSPNRIKMYNDTLTKLNKSIEDHNTALRSLQDKEQIEKDKIAKKSYLEKLATVDLAKGSTTLGEMMFSLGESFYDIFSMPQNLLVKAGVLPKSAEASSKKFKEEFGITNPLLEFYQKETEKLSKEQAIWNNENYDTEGIYENFKKGNWSDGFKQLGSGLAESAPVSIGMMAGGASTSIPKLAAGSTPMFLGPELERLREENPGASEFDLTAKAIGLAGAETVFSAIGSGTLGKVYKDILLKEGKQQGAKVFRNGLIEMYEQALKKAGAPAGALGEGIEEVATQITQNMINGKDPFEGVNDAFIQGVGGGTTYAGPINVMQFKNGIQEALAINKINKSVAKINPDFNVNNITEVYSTPVDLSKPISGLEELKIAQTPKAKTILDQQVTKDLELGKINQEQANNIQENFRDVTQATQQLKPLGLNENVEAASLLIEKNKLQQKIKQVDDSALTTKDTDRVNEINSRLGELVADVETERANVVGMSILPTRKSSPKADELATQYQQDPSAVDIEALLDQYNKIGLAAIKFDTRKGDIAREDAIAEINKEFAGIMDRWSPDKGSFSTFVTANIAPKAQGIYDKYIGQKDATTLDRPEAREVVAEEVDIDVTPQETGRAKIYPSQLEVVAEKLTPEVRETQNAKVKDEIIRSINDKGVSPDIVAKDIIKKTQQKEIRNVIKGAIGRFGSPQYNQFVDDVINQDFINSLPLATIKGRFGKLFGIEEIGRTPTKQIKDGKRTDFKKQVFRIPKTTPEKLQEIKDYFKANEKRSQSLFSILAEGAVVEEVQAMKADADFMNKLNDVLELKGSDLNADQFMDQFQADADQRVKEDVSLDVVEDIVEQTLQEAIDNVDSFIQDQAGTLYAGLPVNQVAKAIKSGLNIIKDTYSKTKDIVKSIKAGIDSIRKALGLSKKEADSLQNTFEQEITQESLENNTLDTEYLVEKVMETDGLKRDKAFEQLIINNAIELESKFPGLKVILKKPSEKGRYRNFDFAFELNGFEFLGESKLDNAQYSSVNGTYDFNTGNFKFTYDKYSPELQSVMDNIVKKSKPKLTSWAKDIKKQGVDLTTSSKKIPKTAWMQAQKAGLQKATTTKETVSADVISELYNKKQPPVYYINIQGQGLFYMGENPLNLPVPKLEGTVDMVFRFKRSGTDANGNITPTLAFVPANIKVTGEKSNFNLDSPKSFEKLMQTPAVQDILKLEDQARNKTVEIAADIVSKKQNATQIKQTLINSQDVRVDAQKVDKKEKGLSAFDFDDTLALTKEKVKYTMPDGTTGELTAGEFAVQAEELTANGAEFDFSNFENVDISTLEGPMVSEARKKQAKFGPKDIFVVTARPGASAEAIQIFLKNIGLNIPISNITGLGNGDPQAKADWFLEKATEGYNDFYFSDDSLLNVQQVKNVLDQIDVKSDVQQAIADKPTRLNKEFNKQIEEVTGKEDFKKYSDARARLEGKQKDKGVFKRFINQFTITPSADDFMGLMYAFMGKGKQGNKHAQFIKENLMDPYNKAEQELLSSKVTVANDFAALREAFPTLKSKRGKNPLMEEIGVGPYSKSQAIRVYMWNKQGMEIPGMSKRDIDALVAAVESDLELKPFADNVILVQKNKQYPAPGANWLAGDITTDILKGLDTTYRKELMTEFNENVDIIFSKENLNKIEAIYGSKFRESLVDSLRRMKTGSNRPVFVGSGSRIVNEMMDWLNSSVGAVMFLNMRSGLLQLISNVNFINWGDNNIYNAAKAFTSKDYFPTVLKLLNSDYLVNRRDGLKINVNEAELADAGRQGGIKGMINYILDKGFAITRVMDSVAIATGGATFFINRKQSLQNRVNPETGKLYTEQEADAKTFDDFYAIAEETQQSSNPSRISQQQASLAGRVILSFQNVTMQYNRKTKKSIQDLYNRRTKPGMTQRESDLSNLSSVMYYVAVQNLVFNALQQALFALAFDDEPEEKDKDKAANIANGMLDSLLFGLGFGGAIVSTVKNVAMKIADESEKKSTQYRDVVWSVFDISPVLDSKVRKLRTAAKTFDWNMDEIKKRGWSLDNPAYLAISQIISASTNLPLDRVLRKAMNIGQAFDEETKTWQRVALLLGWSGWNLDLPYWGRESTIKKEEATEARIKEKYSIDVRKMKSIGFTKRVPLTGPNSGKPSGKLGVDYIQLERPDGKIQYYKKP